MTRKLDYHKMLTEVDELLATDFVFDMIDELYMDSRKFTQAEAGKMAAVLYKCWVIAHAIHCKGCDTPYLK